MFFCIGRISFGMGDGGRKDEHILSFFRQAYPLHRFVRWPVDRYRCRHDGNSFVHRPLSLSIENVVE